MIHYDFFAGISGFGLGAMWSGIETVYTCESSLYRHEFLKRLNPGAIHETDIKTCNPPKAERAIWTGGFPCQDISNANSNAKGIEGERSRLWYDWYRAICVCMPQYIVIENVPALVNRGLRTVLAGLANVGYDAEWQVISKRTLGFSDLRERLFVVAYNHEVGRKASGRVFEPVTYKIVRAQILERHKLESEPRRIYSMAHLAKTHTRFRIMDAGISPKLVRSQIEAIGDSVCPIQAHLIFELIKIHSNEQ